LENEAEKFSELYHDDEFNYDDDEEVEVSAFHLPY
jgi:hypothetical protein